MKRVALINDLSGIGRCSLSVALPIVSVMGHECASLPTAILSNHTAFDNYTFYDFTDKMHGFIDCWRDLGVCFDTVYTGFLGSVHQIDIAIDFINTFGKHAIKLVDPVMGDDGEIYDTYTDEMRKHMKRLVASADIITPNLTELCELCDTAYPTQKISLCDIEKMCAQIGVKKIVVTGLENKTVGDIDKSVIANFVYDGGHTYLVKNKKTPVMYCGTGDVFASVLCGALTSGHSLKSACEIASCFSAECTEYTYENGGDRLYGIMFEKFLYRLCEKREDK